MTPAFDATVAPSSPFAPPLHPPGFTAPARQPAPVIRRPFQRGFLDRKDPFEDAGHHYAEFSTSSSFELYDAPAKDVVKEVQDTLLECFRNSRFPSARLTVVDFDDFRFFDEPPRRFFVSNLATHRDTDATVSVFFRAYGQTLFYSIRSYVLPPMSWWKFTLALLPLLVLSLAAVFVGNSSILGELLGVAFVGNTRFLLLPLFILAFSFRIIRHLIAGDSLSLALRKQFPKALVSATFDRDDVDSFMKSQTSLILRSIGDVLERHDIDISPIKQTMLNFNTHIDVRGGVLNAVGSVFGGSRNTANQTR